MSAIVSFFAVGELAGSGAFLQPARVRIAVRKTANRSKELMGGSAGLGKIFFKFMERLSIQYPKLIGAFASTPSQSISARRSLPAPATRGRRSPSPPPRAAGAHGPARY